MSNRNIRHEIEPHLIQIEIKKCIDGLKVSLNDKIEREKEIHKKYKKAKLEGNAKNWSRPRTNLQKDINDIEKFYNKEIEMQKNYYSTVRIIERIDFKNPYILVYGDVDDETVKEGTGGFSTLERAKEWFLKSGR